MQLGLIGRYAAAAVQARRDIVACKRALHPRMETAGGAVYAKSEELHKFTGLWLGRRSPVSFLDRTGIFRENLFLEIWVPECSAFSAYRAGRTLCGSDSI